MQICRYFLAGGPLQIISTSSLNSTSEMRADSTGRISRTTECTAASTSYPHSDMGNIYIFSYTHICTHVSYTDSGKFVSSCRLHPVDIEFMKALQDKVNVVPLIAKADCLTPFEIKKLKERVRS